MEPKNIQAIREYVQLIRPDLAKRIDEIVKEDGDILFFMQLGFEAGRKYQFETRSLVFNEEAY